MSIEEIGAKAVEADPKFAVFKKSFEERKLESATLKHYVKENFAGVVSPGTGGISSRTLEDMYVDTAKALAKRVLFGGSTPTKSNATTSGFESSNRDEEAAAEQKGRENEEDEEEDTETTPTTKKTSAKKDVMKKKKSKTEATGKEQVQMEFSSSPIMSSSIEKEISKSKDHDHMSSKTWATAGVIAFVVLAIAVAISLLSAIKQ